ncbi:exodeoxyribonuclease V subunit beta [Pseudomonas sp. ZM23]|uniref:RecBCD enzyme subunit RecB n=1 Tax=Pseudomonas triclosanedens TaxID=2961893 RepID=A0ABY7A154_9PSED|nr:exodeoxyribonuclease V subunit beta [Pseudomonas triclosanedens]MCP8464677.1 exodeoxyribonuclease V subunit beta [Pseudomonas triclosanedens]MCP8473608.1 exodeoxyribonuclease V subunit beta [Pseudomonas triclosanedens]MCP8478445.1 exodeoxyribonuclease V subunit beta [Pseudomonas triclosanedens]WAI50843.1 exodeoxyribonuclease V subunit beta [Pseudomonas triclosanedens]
MSSVGSRTPELVPLSFPLHGSRLIEASAGTGKTFTIALLYVRLVLDHGGEQAAFGRPLSPPEILVVTFTEAATQELRERIRARLSEAARCFADPAGEHDGLLAELRDSYAAERWPGCARLLRLAAEWMDEAAVSTIHSWCYRMLREHAFDSGSLFTQDLAADQSELLAEAVRDYWRRNFYPLGAAAANAVRHCYSGPEALARALQPLLAAQEAGFRYADRPLAAPDSLGALLESTGQWYAELDEAETRARQAWAADRGGLAELLRNLRGDLNGNSYRGKDDDAVFAGWIEALDAWSEGAEAPENLAKFGQTRIKVKAKAVVPEHPALQAIDAWVERAEQRPDIAPHLLLHALDEVRRNLEAEKQKRAELGFDDLLVRLDRALAGSTGERLAGRIREQFPVALIDEFQDTDPLQYRIFERIYRIAESPRDLGLFMIGDPKQAIYAFRGADIHTYLRARAATAGRHYTLGTNFRSTQAMVRAANRCFLFAEGHPRAAFRFAVEGQENPVPFLEVGARGRSETLVLEGAQAPAMTFWQLDNDGQVCGSTHYRKEMAARSATAIQRWLSAAQSGGSGLRGADGSWKALRPADIAILVRGRSEAEAIRAELAARRLASVYLSDRDSVFDSQEAADLLHWLRACADPGDDGTLRIALATRSLALDWTTLERLNQDERFWEDMVLRFREYRSLWQLQGVLPMLRRLLADFALPARLLRETDGERSLTNLLHLAEWLQREAVELDGEHALLRVLAEQLESPTSEEILRLESDADLIKVVTIHKSKGLEYPLVLLPFICTWRELDGKSTTPPSFQSGQTRVVELSRDKEQAKAAFQQANDERLSEDMRLLYVALTRARHAVWLGVAPLVMSNSKSPELHKGAMGYLLGGGEALSVAELGERLGELRDGEPGIVLEAAPEADPQVYVATCSGDLGAAREPRRRVAEKWWIASYSALAALAGDDNVESIAPAPAADEPTSAGEDLLREGGMEEAREADVLPAPFSLHAFPRGANPGSFLHGLLEWAADEGFGSCDAQSLRDQLARRCKVRGWESWIEPLHGWLLQLLHTEFRLPDAAPVSLATLSSYQKEMEFWFATHRVDSQRLDRIVTRHTLGGVARPALQANHLNGMLKGFIDLVFEHQGRYYVADYKSNWLGADDDAYTAPALREALLEHRYDLQYALYLFALHRLLQARLPGYDYERHVGGAMYLFLRGSQSATQGMYLERPPKALMDELDRLFRAVDEEIPA